MLTQVACIKFGFKLSILVTATICCSPSVAEEYMSSSIDAFTSQIAAIQQGDVLIRVEEFADRVDDVSGLGDFEETLSLHRYRFDRKVGKHWYFGETIVKKGAVKVAGEMKEGKGVQSIAVIFADNKSRFRYFPYPASPPVAVEDWESLAAERELNLLAFSNLAFTSFGSQSPEVGRLVASVRKACYPGSSLLRGTDGNMKFIFKMPMARPDQALTYTEWTWNPELLAPVRQALITDYVARKNPLRYTEWEESYDWITHNDLLLPDTVWHETPSAFKQGDRVIEYKKLINVKFNWFSVNQPIAEELLNQSMDDIEGLQSSIKLDRCPTPLGKQK